LVVPNQARACTHEELERLIPAGFAGRVFRSSIEDLFPSPDRCVAGGGDTVVVTGSVYLIGEVLARLEPQRGMGEGRLQDF
jgi:dihydrofolate synthase/folylpolyglutamate synthase